MSLPKFTVTPLAKSDIKRSQQWYERQQRGLGKRFAAMLRETFRRIRRDPETCGFALSGVRHALVKVFPYVVYYSYDGAEVVIHCVIHASRDESEWRSRF
jgi:plasmid stabilization system protein ParE